MVIRPTISYFHNPLYIGLLTISQYLVFAYLTLTPPHFYPRVTLRVCLAAIFGREFVNCEQDCEFDRQPVQVPDPRAESYLANAHSLQDAMRDRPASLGETQRGISPTWLAQFGETGHKASCNCRIRLGPGVRHLDVGRKLQPNRLL